MIQGLRIVRSCALLVCLMLSACSKSDKTRNTADAGPIPSGLGVGMSCKKVTECRTGLTCDNISKTCVPGASVIQGGACLLSGECISGYYCNQQGACAASGKLPAGAICSSEGDCASGLLCAQAGLTGVCQAGGIGDINHGCVQTSECMTGLLCISGICTKGTLSPWAGVECNPVQDSIARIYFHVPRATDPTINTDFYRLPFPNDIRIKNGKVNLSGHPRPGMRILPFDLVDRYITTIEAESTGFGANQAIFVRFSKDFNLATFPTSDCGSSLVNITPTSPDYGVQLGFRCSATNARSAYLCGPWMQVHATADSPLRPGTTYALMVKKTISDLIGTPFGADDDFTAMLGPVPPTDPDLVAAYEKYLPLRKYIATGAVTAADLATAAVFTTEKFEDPLAGIETAVQATQAPQVEQLVRCGDPGVVSPCDDGKTGADHARGCLVADATGTSFDTYQGTIGLPVFQKGVVPYLNPSDGGNIEYDATGAAVLQRIEKVCFALSVPKGVAPATGWPLVVYSHGTGGSYRSIVDLGLSQDYAVGAAPAGMSADGGVSTVPVPMAVLGFDGVLHGTRNGGSTKPVGELVYNYLNPSAARDNAMQAVADLMAIPRGLASLAAEGITLDQTRLSLYGHSQGGNAASLVAARQSAYGTIVMSGTGGLLIQSLIGKTQPVNVPAVLPYLLGEVGPIAVNAGHPVLNLMQMYFERSDSVNFGRRLFHEPLATMTAHHILHVYGTNDSYSVVETQQAYALSAGLQVAAPEVDKFGLELTTPPVSRNEYFGPVGKLTAVEIQYKPDATYDGHFVSTQNPSARAAIQQMLVTAARDGVPTVSP
jgi:hypothetical protein